MTNSSEDSLPRLLISIKTENVLISKYNNSKCRDNSRAFCNIEGIFLCYMIKLFSVDQE